MEKTIDLTGFIGSENAYKSCIFVPAMRHTDGVEFFCNEAGAFWFLDIVATEYFKLQKKYPFMSITLSSLNEKATISVEDGDCNTIAQKKIEYTDCPTGIYGFFLIDNILMLKGEY
jgi:hypothetical protein